MTDEECREVYQQLITMLNDRELLNDHQMNWVVEEVNEVIRAGKIIYQPSETSSSVSSRRFITTREYTPQENLLLLIDAIESVVVQTAFIERETTNFFLREGEEFNIYPELIFVSEEENTEQIVYNNISAFNRAEQAIVLERLLNQLRAEVRG